MGSRRFIGVISFYLIGIVLSVIGVVVACYYQEVSSNTIRQAEMNFQAVERHVSGMMMELRVKEEQLSPPEMNKLRERDLNIRERYLQALLNLERVKSRYRGGIRRRNYALMFSVLGFAMMAWGLFRVLKD
ncbi:MAG: hypothetical protein ACYS8W_12720 [Planctomycetota bacterium]